MMRCGHSHKAAFSLVEIMIAILFISIGFFGYVALHARILHSGQRLEEKEIVRSGTDFMEAIEVARITWGVNRSVSGEEYFVDRKTIRLFHADTALEGRNREWVESLPELYRPGLEETMQISPSMYFAPYRYGWATR